MRSPDDEIREWLFALSNHFTATHPHSFRNQPWFSFLQSGEFNEDEIGLVQIAVVLERTFFEKDPATKLLLVWNLGKRWGSLGGQEKDTTDDATAKRFHQILDAQREAGRQRRKPDTIQLVRRLDELLLEHPQRTLGWAARNLARQMLPAGDQREVKKRADSLRKRYASYKKVNGGR